jgi:serine/threonine protein kinase
MLDINWNRIKGLGEIVDAGISSITTTQGEYDKHYKFIVLRELGKSLLDIFNLNNKLLKQVDLIKLGILIIDKIEKLHRIGYLHLDIKPDNMVLDREPEVKYLNTVQSY